jgi:hypothetical protein
MRAPLLAFLLALAFPKVSAQGYGNEWIHYDRSYWSFKVWTDGVRKIDSLTLANAGFPVAAVDPRNIQLFARGRQVPVHVQGGEDGVFNAADFLEFHAARNDAWLDSTLWDDPAHINNPWYSLYNDTIRYYLSWGPPEEALPMVGGNSSNWAAWTPLSWAWATTRLQYTGTYQTGTRTAQGISTAAISEGEGFFHSSALNTSGADLNQAQNLAIGNIYQGSRALRRCALPDLLGRAAQPRTRPDVTTTTCASRKAVPRCCRHDVFAGYRLY